MDMLYQKLYQTRTFLALFILLGVSSLGVSQEPYFPPNTFGQGQWAESEAGVNSFFLKRIEEPSLFTKAQSKSAEAYRFLWLRTFHYPIAVRVEVQPDGSSVLTIKVADGHSGFPHTVTKLIQNTSRSLTREETNAFRKKVRAEGFWNAATRDTGGPAATDCDGWILEGVSDGKYHIVSRAIPNRLPKTARMIHSLGLMFAIELGRMEIPEKER